jgi:hypothetical protein
MLSQESSDTPPRARRAETHRAVESRESKEQRKSREQRHRETQRHKKVAEAPRLAERESRNTKGGEAQSREAFPGSFFSVFRAWLCGRLRPATSEAPAAK